MIFYVFETRAENIYKFGMSNKQLRIDRLRQYDGINKPKRIITLYNVSDGLEEEENFKGFLSLNNVPIVSGREFFKYKGNINVLISKYRLGCEGIKLNIQTNSNHNTFRNVIANLHNDKTNKEISTQTDSDIIKPTLLQDMKPMLPQDMKRCSVCTLRKSDRHFIRKEKIYKTCNECSEYRKKCHTSTLQNDNQLQNVNTVLIHMKLKYLIICKHKYLFCYSLENLASHYNITLSGLRYRMKNKLIDLKKINIKLYRE